MPHAYSRATKAHDNTDGIRLQKLLAQAGFGSRRKCEEIILDGRVEVDGELVTELGTRVDPKRQQVRVDGSRVRINPNHVTLALNKPRKVLSTMDDPKGRRISGTVCRRLVSQGVQLDDGWIKLDHCAILDSSRDTTLVKVVLHSGKNRVVRRIFGAVGFPVKRLVRTQIGPIKLGDIKPGSYRVLSQTEVRSLSKEVGL